MLAIDARARGMALRRARFRPPSGRSAWANSILGVIPWSPSGGDRVVDALRGAIATTLTTALPGQGVLPVIPAIFRSSAVNCSSIAR